MSRYIMLDSGVVGLLTHPQPRVVSESVACRAWLRRLLVANDTVLLPEAVDYEVRREYLRRGARRALQHLDAIAGEAIYLPLTTPVWRRAAALWAQARNQGHITAPPGDLNIDILLAAQAQLLLTPDQPVIIATTNVRHLAPFADARLWPAV